MDVQNNAERIRIGNALRQKRESAGLSLRQLAERTGVNYANISKIEAGRYGVSVDTLSKIASALGVKLELVPVSE